MPEAATAVVDRPYRFAVAARERFVGTYSDRNQALGTTLETVDIPAGDFTAGVYLQVDCVTAGNAATVVFAGDAPFSAIQEVQLLDPQGVPFQILSGYELFAWTLNGGFTGQTDATLSPYFTTVPGVGAGLGGGFTFFLRIPAELFPRDGIGTLYNGATSSQFKVRIVLGTSAAVYTTPPTTLANVRVRMHSHGYQLAQQLPSGHAFETEPPGGPIYNNLNRQIFQFAGAGNLTLPLQRKGFLYREIIFIVRDATGVRSSTLISDATFTVDNINHFAGPTPLLRQTTWERGKNPTGTLLPAGVFLQSFCHDWDGTVGGETRDGYVPTTPGSISQATFVATAAGSVTLLVNDVTPTEMAIAAGVVKV